LCPLRLPTLFNVTFCNTLGCANASFFIDETALHSRDGDDNADKTAKT